MSCDSKYNTFRPICIIILSTYAEVDKVEVISIPSNVARVTPSMSGKGGGMSRFLEAGR